MVSQGCLAQFSFINFIYLTIYIFEIVIGTCFAVQLLIYIHIDIYFAATRLLGLKLEILHYAYFPIVMT